MQFEGFNLHPTGDHSQTAGTRRRCHLPMLATMKASQPTLPGVRDWREPQLVSAQRLASTITEAASAGFEAIRLECWQKPFGYRVTFQRMADASESRNARPAQMMDGCPPEKSGNPTISRPAARKIGIREPFYAPTFQK